ncbi:MAG: UDP-N-acetylmuramoyl-L-alanine--D-glutamate ligase [Candidatus Omnitrophota bacterium]|jgi:UDP-N-acetylmuramoylalanine--D-glutamate ligase|nr:MAG: UDP-N-acetylmuramoyl-L-alanine--D-glutamate ligase [Candidatus Omnitrophota bacterium]
MKNTEYFKGKKITVVGLARSGSACAALLSSLGAEVYVTELQDNEVTRRKASELIARGIQVELGLHSEGFIAHKDMVVLSPGVENTALPVVWADQFGVPIVSEIEIGWMVCPARIIAVTGSNGKTTVTTLIGQVIEAAGKKALVCGNIGTPFTSVVAAMVPEDYVSLEVSSFQLERIRTFRPFIACVLNFTRNHLDRYRSMEEYVQAKKRIAINQGKGDSLVLNYNDETARGLAKETKAEVIYFYEGQKLNPNQAAVMAVGSILGIRKDTMEEVFKGFKGLSHRMEYVAQIANVTFVNDSKATTADSTLWALKNIQGRVILIAGGKDKGVDYRLILGVAKDKVKELILIGEAAAKIETALRNAFPIQKATTLQEAVEKAYRDAEAGDYVLLSPMCSSFDMFLNYEERGEVFREAVKKLLSANRGAAAH